MVISTNKVKNISSMHDLISVQNLLRAIWLQNHVFENWDLNPVSLQA